MFKYENIVKEALKNDAEMKDMIKEIKENMDLLDKNNMKKMTENIVKAYSLTLKRNDTLVRILKLTFDETTGKMKEIFKSLTEHNDKGQDLIENTLELMDDFSFDELKDLLSIVSDSYELTILRNEKLFNAILLDEVSEEKDNELTIGIMFFVDKKGLPKIGFCTMKENNVEEAFSNKLINSIDESIRNLEEIKGQEIGKVDSAKDAEASQVVFVEGVTDDDTVTIKLNSGNKNNDNEAITKLKNSFLSEFLRVINQ